MEILALDFFDKFNLLQGELLHKCNLADKVGTFNEYAIVFQQTRRDMRIPVVTLPFAKPPGENKNVS